MSALLVPSRRGFLTGLGALLCAPAIVRVASLMPVKALPRGIVVGFDLATIKEEGTMVAYDGGVIATGNHPRALWPSDQYFFGGGYLHLLQYDELFADG